LVNKRRDEMNTKRRHLTLLVDGELIDELKSNRENLSKIAEDAFKARLDEIKPKSKKSIFKDNKGEINPATDTVFKLVSADHNV